MRRHEVQPCAARFAAAVVRRRRRRRRRSFDKFSVRHSMAVSRSFHQLFSSSFHLPSDAAAAVVVVDVVVAAPHAPTHNAASFNVTTFSLC